MPRLELYTFNYRDPRTGNWIRARYRAERSDIEQRHSEFEITGPAEIRDINTEARHFNPHFKLMMNAELRPFNERAPELQRHPPAADAVEAFLVGLFLRRYVT